MYCWEAYAFELFSMYENWNLAKAPWITSFALGVNGITFMAQGDERKMERCTRYDSFKPHVEMTWQEPDPFQPQQWVRTERSFGPDGIVPPKANASFAYNSLIDADGNGLLCFKDELYVGGYWYYTSTGSTDWANIMFKIHLRPRPVSRNDLIYWLLGDRCNPDECKNNFVEEYPCIDAKCKFVSLDESCPIGVDPSKKIKLPDGTEQTCEWLNKRPPRDPPSTECEAQLAECQKQLASARLEVIEVRKQLDQCNEQRKALQEQLIDFRKFCLVIMNKCTQHATAQDPTSEGYYQYVDLLKSTWGRIGEVLNDPTKDPCAGTADIMCSTLKNIESFRRRKVSVWFSYLMQTVWIMRTINSGRLPSDKNVWNDETILDRFVLPTLFMCDTVTNVCPELILKKPFFQEDIDMSDPAPPKETDSEGSNEDLHDVEGQETYPSSQPTTRANSPVPPSEPDSECLFKSPQPQPPQPQPRKSKK